MNFLKRILSLARQYLQELITNIFGFSVVIAKWTETLHALKIQSKYNLSAYKIAEKVVVFIEVEPYRMCGGQMSIFTLCKYSKELLEPTVPVLMTTMPGFFTYAHNDNFENSIDIHRWQQIRKIIKGKSEVIIHIPESCVALSDKEIFISRLKKVDLKIFKTIGSLHINILNQNIEAMPDTHFVNKLRELTCQLTQSVAHDRYCTQEVANKFNLPTNLFLAFIELPEVKHVPHAKKINIILFSPDLSPQGLRFKECFVRQLINKFPTFYVDRIWGMTYEEYIKKTALSKYVITFGEGFDGYFNNSAMIGTLCFAVYNDEYFPNKNWLEYRNVYNSFESMLDEIVDDIKFFESNTDEYYKVINEHRNQIDLLYSKEKVTIKLKQFYFDKKYDYYPSQSKQE